MSADLLELFLELSEREQRLPADKVLFRAEDRIRFLFLVIAGEVRLVRHLPQGFQLTLQRAGPGAILAEASLFAEHYHCDALAAEDSIIRAVPIRKAQDSLERQPALSAALLRHLAREVQRMRSRAEMLSLKTVAARVDAWMALNGGILPPRGRWHHVAFEIGVTPEALYRELARRRSYVS